MIKDADWMAYIDGEVQAVCKEKGWGHQVRRKWSVREKPVSSSSVGDYEWKLIPDASGKLPTAESRDHDGCYYVFGFNREGLKFILQHDTIHLSIWSPAHEVATYTEIQFGDLERIRGESPDSLTPEDGWLRGHLLRLVAGFGPNRFSIT